MPRLKALAGDRAEPSQRAPIANQMMRGRGFFYAAHDTIQLPQPRLFAGALTTGYTADTQHGN